MDAPRKRSTITARSWVWAAKATACLFAVLGLGVFLSFPAAAADEGPRVTNRMVPRLGRAIGARLHADWQTNFRQQNPEATNRWKPAKSRRFSTTALKELKEAVPGNKTLRRTKAGVELDILNRSFEQLSPVWQRENLNAGRVVAGVLHAARQAGISESMLGKAVSGALGMNRRHRRIGAKWAESAKDPELRKAREFVVQRAGGIHSAWLGRNPWAPAAQQRSFERLSTKDQALDLTQLRVGLHTLAGLGARL